MNSPSTANYSYHSHNTAQKSHSHTSNFSSANIRTNPHINTTFTQTVTKVQKIPPNFSTTPPCHTIPPSTINTLSVSNQTYINTSAYISEDNKPFDG